MSNKIILLFISVVILESCINPNFQVYKCKDGKLYYGDIYFKDKYMANMFWTGEGNVDIMIEYCNLICKRKKDYKKIRRVFNKSSAAAIRCCGRLGTILEYWKSNRTNLKTYVVDAFIIEKIVYISPTFSHYSELAFEQSEYCKGEVKILLKEE